MDTTTRPGLRPLTLTVSLLGLALVGAGAWLGLPAWLSRVNEASTPALFGLALRSEQWLLAAGALWLGALLLALGRRGGLGALVAWSGAVASLAKPWLLPFRALEDFEPLADTDPSHALFWWSALAFLPLALGCALASRAVRGHIKAGGAPRRAGLGFALAFPLVAVAGPLYACTLAQEDVFRPVLVFAVPAALALAVAAWRRRPTGWAIATLGLLAAALLLLKPALVPSADAYGDSDYAEGGAHGAWIMAGLLLLGALIVGLSRILGLGFLLGRRRGGAPRLRAGERIIELQWRCSSCGADNLGRYLRCPSCGSPKEADERHALPADTRQAESVTDPALLAKALAAPNWRCASCGSDQRAADGRCQSCGAPAEGAPPATAANRPALTFPAVLPGAAVLGLCMALGLAPGLAAERLREAPVRATVVAAHWRAIATPEHRELVAREGFASAQTASALEVKKAGQRPHHTETVCAETGMETYTEEVRVGTRTEHYTEEEECGETCTGGSGRSCHEECEDTGTGFARCREVCSGQDQVCRPRYCKRTRTREIPVTRSEERTRSVCKRHAQIERQADWFTWKEWTWQPEQPLVAEGEGVPIRWPEMPAPAGDPDRWRLARRVELRVELRGEEGQSFVYQPEDAAIFARLPLGAEVDMAPPGRDPLGRAQPAMVPVLPPAPP
ncbi:MAG TPA: zinc finger Ran-binding domain-containing protein [Myxococcota bacterium]|nr:zinc finger Ran-binding domain-containing protein [Myxococcota bacterium]HRY92807.1 zinc finger Ran-binding domain-containing protein [Myxococcota bacterium]HSA19817.1 zinc finger Ran-binding domain-containing protein [Myxococcota bacterium]